MAVGSLPRCCRLLGSGRRPRRGSLCQNRFRISSSSDWHSTSRPFRGLKRRHHGLSGAKTQTTRQSFFVSALWRLHSLDQLCHIIVYWCANFQCESLRMKETSSCGVWGDRPCRVWQLRFSVTRVLRASDRCWMLPTLSESVKDNSLHPSRRSHSSWPRESARQNFDAFHRKFH